MLCGTSVHFTTSSTSIQVKTRKCSVASGQLSVKHLAPRTGNIKSLSHGIYYGTSIAVTNRSLDHSLFARSILIQSLDRYPLV